MTAFPQGLLAGAGVYLVANAATRCGADLHRAVAAALAAGVRLVQYRDKAPMSQSQITEVSALCALAREHGALLLINDRVDLALATEAHGVHLGQDDLPIATARALLPQGACIGISTHNLDEALAAEAAGADYVGFGNVFGTTTKADALPPCGTAPLAAVCAALSIPVYAIGGVNLDNLNQVKAAGADGGALVGAILGADDPGFAAQTLLTRWAKKG